MTEVPKQPFKNNEDSQRKSGYDQYQHQTLTLHNKVYDTQT